MNAVKLPITARRNALPATPRNSRFSPSTSSSPGTSQTTAASKFTGNSDVVEWHVATTLTGDAPNPAIALESQWLADLERTGIDPATTVFRRVFCSDVVNQRPTLERFANAYPGAFSAIGQPPAKGGRLAVWSYHLANSGKPLHAGGSADCFSITRGPVRHSWICGLSAPSNTDASAQSHAILTLHDHALASHGMTLHNDVIRTWWFLRDIDNDYHGFVDARKDAFTRHNLTPETHYIASTAIAGAPPEPAARVALDSLAISGLLPQQVQYLTAPDHLGPTQNYGVTFERATAVSYADRRHIFISGTASIDPSGSIVHPGDVLRQLDRALANIAALLNSTSAKLDALAIILVYLRDLADSHKVHAKLRNRFPSLPIIILHAPVCRPGWLIEVEGIAIQSSKNPALPDF